MIIPKENIQGTSTITHGYKCKTTHSHITTCYSQPYEYQVLIHSYNFVVLSVVEVCVDHGGVNVFYVCIDFCIVYGVGVCVNVCGVVCVVVCCLFLTSGCCLLCCNVLQWVG